jgi:hypothetical protein
MSRTVFISWSSIFLGPSPNAVIAGFIPATQGTGSEGARLLSDGSSQ